MLILYAIFFMYTGGGSKTKKILFLQRDLGVPIERISVEESMAHVKRGKRGRLDVVVYRGDEKKDAVLVIECKALEVAYL